MVQHINAAALLSVPANVMGIANMSFRRMVSDVHLWARENVTRGRPDLIARSGALYRSITKGPYIQNAPNAIAVQEIRVRARYARTQEFGATIVPKRRPYLVFRLYQPTDTDRPTGPWRMAKRVVIPPRPYMRPAAERGVRDWPVYVRRTVNYVVQYGRLPGGIT